MVQIARSPSNTRSKAANRWHEEALSCPVQMEDTWKEVSQRISHVDLLGHVVSRRYQGLARAYAEGFLGIRQSRPHPKAVESDESLRRRLSNANNHFRRKAAEVLGHEDAVLLLANLYQQSNVKLEDLDVCQRGVALAKLAAANFCEIGANVIYITEAGQGFIESIDRK